MSGIDPALIPIIESLALDAVHWFQQRQQDDANPPTDEQIIARVRAKIQAGNDEGDAWLKEHPDA